MNYTNSKYPNYGTKINENTTGLALSVSTEYDLTPEVNIQPTKQVINVKTTRRPLSVNKAWLFEFFGN